MAEHADQRLGGVEYTLDWYRDFLARLRAERRGFGTFSGPPDDGTVLLRHDVDLSTRAAVRMARLEADEGVRATYCFLLTSPLYNLLGRECRDHVDEIASLGHEVALHFSTHEYWPADEPPDEDALAAAVARELSVLEALGDGVEPVVSFHIPPEWVLDRAFDGFRSTYAPAYFGDVGYVADSTQRWREEPPELDWQPGAVQVLTHPGLWGPSDATFEERVDRAVGEACRRAGRKATGEFLRGGRSR